MAKRMVCRVADVPENTLKECEAEGGLKLVVANAGGEFVGFQAMCPHQDAAVRGLVRRRDAHLPHAPWQWDVRSGAPLGTPEAPLQRYPLARGRRAVPRRRSTRSTSASCSMA